MAKSFYQHNNPHIVYRSGKKSFMSKTRDCALINYHIRTTEVKAFDSHFGSYSE